MVAAPLANIARPWTLVGCERPAHYAHGTERGCSDANLGATAGAGRALGEAGLLGEAAVEVEKGLERADARQRRRRTKPVAGFTSSPEEPLCSHTWAALLLKFLSSMSFVDVGDRVMSVGLVRWAAGSSDSGDRLGGKGLEAALRLLADSSPMGESSRDDICAPDTHGFAGRNLVRRADARSPLPERRVRPPGVCPAPRSAAKSSKLRSPL